MGDIEFYTKKCYGMCFSSVADNYKVKYNFGDIVGDGAIIYWNINDKYFQVIYPIKNILFYLNSKEWKISLTETRKLKIRQLKNGH